MPYVAVQVNNVEEGPAESYALYRFLGIVVGMAMAQGTATLVFQVRSHGCMPLLGTRASRRYL